MGRFETELIMEIPPWTESVCRLNLLLRRYVSSFRSGRTIVGIVDELGWIEITGFGLEYSLLLNNYICHLIVDRLLDYTTTPIRDVLPIGNAFS